MKNFEVNMADKLSSDELPGLSLPSSLYYFKETKCWRDKMLLIPHHIQALTTSVVAAVLLLGALLLFLAIKLLFTARDSRPVDVESGSTRGKRRRKCQNRKIRTSPKPKTKQSPNQNIPPVHRDAKRHVAFSGPRGRKEKRRDLREDGDLSSGGSGYFSRSSDDEPSKKAASSSATRKSKVIKPSHKRPGPFKTRVLEERKEMPAEETESRLPSPIVDGRDLNLSNRQEELISSITDNSHSYPSECVYDFTSKQSQSKFFAIPSENGPRSMQGGKRKNDVESQLGKNFQPIKPKKRVPGKSRNTAIDRTADHELLHVTPVREMQRIVNKDCEVTEPFPPSEIAESEADNGLRSRTENTIHPNNNPVSLLSLGSKPTDDTLAKQDNERNNRIQALLNETKRLQEMWERRKAAEEIARDDEEEQTQDESTEHEIPSSETIPHIPASEHELSPSNGNTPTETLAGERLAEINQMSGFPSKTDRTNQPKHVESQPQPSDVTVASTDHSQLGFEAPMHLTAHYDRSFSDLPPTTSQICLSTPAEYSPLRSISDQPSETGYRGQPSESLPSYTPHSSQFNYDTMSKMSFVPTSQSGNRSESLHTPPVLPPFPKEIVLGTRDQQQTSETSEAHSFNLTSFHAKPSPHPSAIVPQKPPQLRSNGETLLNPSMPFYHSPISDTVSHHQLPELSASNMSPSFHKSVSDSYAVPFVSTPTPDAEEFENKRTDYFQQIGNHEEAVGELSEKFRPPEAEAGHVIDEPQREYQRPGSELSEERDQSSEERDQSSEERDQSSGERDQSSEVRDKSSEERDQSREERDQSSEDRDQSHVEQTVHTSVPTGGLKDEVHYQDEGRELQGDVEETPFSTDVVQEKFPNVQPEASRRKEGKEKTKEAVLKEIEDTVRAVSRGSEGDSVTEGVEKHEGKAKEKEGLGLEERRKEEETVKLKNVHENESIGTENKTGATALEKDSQRVMDLQDELVEAGAKIRDSGNSEQREEIETRSQSGRENEKESEEETKQPKTAKKEIVEENEGQEKGMTGLGSQEVKEEGTESLEKVSEKESSDRESKTAEKALKEDSERGDKVRDAETREQTEEMETSSPQLVEVKVEVPEEEIKQAEIVGRVEVEDKEQDKQGDVKTDQDKEISEGDSETGQNIPEEDTMSVKKQKDEGVVETNVNTGGIERDKKTTPSKLEKVRGIFSPGKIKEKILKKESTRPEDAGDEDITSRASKGESGIPSLVVVEEHQGGEETVSEEKKKEDVKQGTWKGSVLSLKSQSKQPHSFKHVVFDQEASLFYDVKGKWEKLGYGNLTISVDEKKKAELEFLDGVEQIARHPVRKETQLVPARGTDRAYVWTTEAHIKGEKKVQKKTLFVRFREADTANQFQEEFRNAQSEEKLAEMLKSRRRQSGEGEEGRVRRASKESSGGGSISSGDVEPQKNEGNLEIVSKESKEDKKQSTWKGSTWSLKSFLKEPHQGGEETVSEEKKKEDVKQSTWKGSVLSLKSLSKQPHSFKHVIFDQKASLFYNVKGKWEKLGYGNLTISVDEKKKAELEFLDGVEQIARHPVRKETQLVPARGTDRAYVWTTEAHIKGEKKVQKKTLFVRFREADTANQFQEEFRNAQSEEKLAEMLKSRRRQSGGDAVSLPESIPEEQQAPEVEGDKNRAEKEGEGDQIRVEASKNAGGDQRGKIKEDASDEPEEMKIKSDEAEKSRDIGEKATEGTEIIGKEDYKSDTPSKDKSAVEGTPLGESKEREELGETPETKLEEEDVSEVNPPVAQEQQKHRDGGEDGKTDIPVAEKSVGGGKEDRGADSQEAETDDGDEVILTAEVELFYDRDGKWDKQGSGVIKIVSLSKDGAYQVRMKKGDTFIANHRVKKETKLVPAKGSDRCYVWTTDNSFSVGKPKRTTFFARFKTYSDAESFRRHFEEGQAKKKKETPLKSKLGKEKR